VRDIVGLYLNPPDKALVLCVDEKSQVQALERTQPVLPMGLGYVEGVTHDYYRHGTTTLFAALDTLDGKVITLCKPRHRHQEFLAFLNHLDRRVPAGLDIHLVADNYGTHKHPKVKTWLARRPRYHIHYTPTYASWLNQVERWFGLITQQAIRRGSFRSVSELVQKIDAYVVSYNLHHRPFAWTATADSILAKLQRLCKVINGTSHYPCSCVAASTAARHRRAKRCILPRNRPNQRNCECGQSRDRCCPRQPELTDVELPPKGSHRAAPAINFPRSIAYPPPDIYGRRHFQRRLGVIEALSPPRQTWKG